MDVFRFHTIIIGSGAAGLNCALWLAKYGIPPEKIAIVSENLTHGTSFDAGSDKQTYYKLSLVGDIPDAPVKMAHALFDGGAMHGDIALIEATMSTQAFMHLVSIGVPFPQDETGGFVGYKTDNDPLQRGTSAGPLTSHIMGNQLLREVQRYGIPIYDKYYVFQILKSSSGAACGILTFHIPSLEKQKEFTANQIISGIQPFQADNIVLATGGPAGCYQYSVYPESQWGATGLAIQAGCKLQNLTESQFGLASLKFRWNVSGTYQQVIPKYVSLPVDCDPNNPNIEPVEFLQEYFPSFKELSKAIFLKGYQWPFNPQRIQNFGSSLIDLAIHHEIQKKGRRVFMDFRKNPSGYDLNNLENEPKEYLINSGAIQNTPFERLAHMNFPAIELYRSHNIDLSKEPLEVGICVQHCNGGVTGDIWWQSSIPNLFAIGEVNGSHGIHRPGGAALNSGQVGAIRAAMKIAYGENSNQISSNEFHKILQHYQNISKKFIESIQISSRKIVQDNINQRLSKIHHRMNQWGMYIRTGENLLEIIREIEDEIASFDQNVVITSEMDLIQNYRIWDALLSQHAILLSIYEYIKNGGGSRGSSIIISSKDVNNDAGLVHPLLEKYSFQSELITLQKEIMELTYQPFILGDKKKPLYEIVRKPRREIPLTTNWFEKIYNEFRNKLIFNIENIR